jgi:hypothetical protein
MGDDYQEGSSGAGFDFLIGNLFPARGVEIVTGV